jgi:hypothetical protein
VDEPAGFLPGERTLLHAHNCYPYHGQHADRLQRALSTGTPIVIEQDLTWYSDPETGRAWSIVGHNCPCDGTEPTLEEHFFDAVLPIVEDALASGDRSNWPLIILHLDIKTHEPEHLAAIWSLLQKYERWLTTAPRNADPSVVAPLEVGPVLALTEDRPEREAVFHDQVPVGDKLLIFGAVDVNRFESASAEQRAELLAASPPEDLIVHGTNNYRRWWNNPWAVVEQGGQNQAGDWTPQDAARLRQLVDYAHGRNLWIRFYCLNGHDPADESGGWSRGYNFGSLEAVKVRWAATRDAGVDFIATDQFEDLAATLRE